MMNLKVRNIQCILVFIPSISFDQFLSFPMPKRLVWIMHTLAQTFRCSSALWRLSTNSFTHSIGDFSSLAISLNTSSVQTKSIINHWIRSARFAHESGDVRWNFAWFKLEKVCLARLGCPHCHWSFWSLHSNSLNKFAQISLSWTETNRSCGRKKSNEKAREVKIYLTWSLDLIGPCSAPLQYIDHKI
jgi:hypothetical protein